MWPALLVATLTMTLSAYAIVASWRAGAQVERNAASIAQVEAVRCQREQIWLTVAPTTPLEAAIRSHVLKTHDACTTP